MSRLLSALIALCLVLLPFVAYVPQSYSDELDDLNKEISKLTEALNMSIAATKPLESQLTSMQQQNLFIPQLQQGSLGENAIAIGGAILPLYSHFAPDKTVLLKGGVPDRLSNH